MRRVYSRDNKKIRPVLLIEQNTEMHYVIIQKMHTYTRKQIRMTPAAVNN